MPNLRDSGAIEFGLNRYFSCRTIIIPTSSVIAKSTKVFMIKGLRESINDCFSQK
jgi:hypothetical protein